MGSRDATRPTAPCGVQAPDRPPLLVIVLLAALAAFVAAFLCPLSSSVAAAAPSGPVATAIGAPSLALSPGVAYVRVNQVGYTAALSKRAYLMMPIVFSGATFVVVDAHGSIVFSGVAGADLGGWNGRFPAVYPLDFSPVSEPGSYRVEVLWPLTAASPSFGIGDGASVYGGALANALRFYQVQRDGPDYVRSELRRAPAHLNDSRAMTCVTPKVDADGVFRGDLKALGVRRNVSGGWWDAGDYLKFVQTTSYTDALLLAGVRDYPAEIGPGSGADFTAEARFGASWLLRMWDDATKTLYYQVGIGAGNAATAGDHDIWRLPQRDDAYGGADRVYRYIRHRPAFRAGPPGSKISPNLAGRDAAALAEAYQVFKGSDPAFADRCLLAAQHIFDLADTSPHRLLTAIPWDFYPETEWRDDLELGATELYLALAPGELPAGLPHTDPAVYLALAAHWAHAYITGPSDAADTLNLYDDSGFAHYDLCRALTLAGDPGGLEVTRADLLGDLQKQLDKAVAQARTDPFQAGYAWDQWDTATHDAGLAVTAGEYDELTGTADYADWASRWLANVLGANAWGSSFVVGDGTTFPHRLQHQVANLRGSLNGYPPVLLGACVEGPNSDQDMGTMPHMRIGPPANPFSRFNGHGARWRDAVQDYPNTEPAIDLTAPTVLAFARMAAGVY